MAAGSQQAPAGKLMMPLQKIIRDKDVVKNQRPLKRAAQG
jgi:hypothetical protein